MRKISSLVPSATDETDGNLLFVYGTLLQPAVIEALIGRVPHHLPATLPGYGRYRLTGEVFPAITVEPAARVDGLVYRNVSDRERMIVDAFESSIYARRRVDAHTRLKQIVTADAYVLDDEHNSLIQRAPAWSLDDFTAHSSAPYIRMCAEFRARWQNHPAPGPRATAVEAHRSFTGRAGGSPPAGSSAPPARAS